MRSATLASFMAIGMCVGLSACGSGAQDATPWTGQPVLQVLVDTLPEPSGDNCDNGGVQIVVGYDDDKDGELAEDEVTSHSYVCSGVNGGDGSGERGADGENGQDGADGSDGVDGTNGTNGVDGTNGTDGTNGVDGTNGTNGENGTGFTALVRTAFESPGLNCLHGGIQIQSGTDSDRSGALDDAEVTTTNYVCNGAAGLNGGADGLSSLVRTSIEAPGQNCAAGGTRIEMGIDDNESTVLDASEVDSVSFVCAGASGAVSLVATQPELAGAHCPAGGTRVDSGVDDDGDKVLQPSEIDQTIYVCDGINGANGANGTNGQNGADGLTTLARTSVEAAGANCALGGLKLETGLDTNKNGALGDAEVLSTNYVCNGANGQNGTNGTNGIDAVNGLNSLVRTGVELAGSHCALGGLKLESGLDANKNGLLNDTEVLATNYVCNGQNGADGVDGVDGVNGLASLVRAGVELGGAHCLVGGVKLESGLDTNKNGSLDNGEVLATNYVCNGQSGLNGIDGLDGINGTNGVDGLNGLASLVRTSVELAGAHCLIGGLKLESGVDTNKNGVLNDAEVVSTSYVCNGSNGTNGSNGSNGTNGVDGINGLASLVRTSLEGVGANCALGGLKLETGLDANKNGVLNDAEVAATSYVCNGQNGTNGSNGTNGTNGTNGLNTLVKHTLEPIGANCSTGGLKLQTGLDANKNGTLEVGEVATTDYVCNGLNGINGINGTNGTNGANSLIKTVPEPALGPNCVLGGLKITSGPDLNGNLLLEPAEVTATSYLCL